MGGTLYQDIEHHWQDSSGRVYYSKISHQTWFCFGKKIYGEVSHINSFHHQSIKDLAENVEVIAHDPKDNTIEAITTTDEIVLSGSSMASRILI